MTGNRVALMFAALRLCLPAAAAAAETAAPLGQAGEGELAALLTAVAKVSGALALVVGLMFLVFLLVKKFDLGRSRLTRGSLIEVLDTRMIAPRKYISVIHIGGELLAVGVSEQQISMLTRLDPCAAKAPARADEKMAAAAAPSGAFAALLERAGFGGGSVPAAADGGTENSDGDRHA